MEDKTNILGIKVDNLFLEEALKRVEEIIAARKPCYYGCINLNQIILYKENKRLRDIIDHADLLTVDGQPVVWISHLLKTPIKQKLPGADFMLEVCRLADQKDYKIFMLGGSLGAAEKAIENMQRMGIDFKVAGVYSPPFGFEKDEQEMNKINNMLLASRADILFVGVGSPKQDVFIDDNKDIYQIPLSCSIGIAIDYYGGKIRKAPKWVSNLGMEWFFRFCQAPRKLFRRYFIDSWRILKYYRDFKKDTR